ncbi:hypothetical protein J6590_105610 [Homalodisca vitripennis]|nr:hypothetical protein J6590_105610 [Homalodisca vitripennis]
MIDNTVTAAAPRISDYGSGGVEAVLLGSSRRVVRPSVSERTRRHTHAPTQDHGCIVNGVLQVYSSSFWQKNYLDKTASKKYSRLHRFHARRNPAPHIILCSGSYGPIPDSIQAR